MTSEEKRRKIIHIHLPKEEIYTTTLTAGNHELTADEPETVEGGKDRGADPYDYLLMSLGSCSVMTVKMYARRKEWNIGDIYMELRHYKRHDEDCLNCEKPSAKLDFIEKELIVKGDLSDDQLEKLLEISKKCPVHRTLMSDIRIESTVSQS